MDKTGAKGTNKSIPSHWIKSFSTKDMSNYEKGIENAFVKWLQKNLLATYCFHYFAHNCKCTEDTFVKNSEVVLHKLCFNEWPILYIRVNKKLNTDNTHS